MKRGICDFCHQKIKLTRKGVVKRHSHPHAEGHIRCHGSKRVPRVIVAERVAGLSPLAEQRHSGVQMGGAL